MERARIHSGIRSSLSDRVKGEGEGNWGGGYWGGEADSPPPAQGLSPEKSLRELREVKEVKSPTIVSGRKRKLWRKEKEGKIAASPSGQHEAMIDLHHCGPPETPLCVLLLR